MKFTLAIPSVRLPAIPSLHHITKSESQNTFSFVLHRSQFCNKWLCNLDALFLARILYELLFMIEQPRINHETYQRFGADSPTYSEAVL